MGRRSRLMFLGCRIMREREEGREDERCFTGLFCI